MNGLEKPLEGSKNPVKSAGSIEGRKMAFRKKILLGTVFILIFSFLFDGFIKGAGALTIEEEKKLGRRILLEMEKSVEPVKDLTLLTFLERLGHSLAVQVGSTPFEFRFYLINSSEPNAFAIPGGYIFCTTGLFVLAENEQEIAGVLSHEISHVTERHVAQMIERGKRLNLATMAAMIAGALLGGGGKTSGAVAATAMATAEAFTLKYTRENEVDADRNSLQYIIQAGYDPNGLITFLNKIYKASLTSGTQILPYLSTHPAVENRIAFLENLLQTGPKRKGPFRMFGNFKRIQAKAFVEQREPNVATTHYQSLIDTNPMDIEGYYGLGLAYQKMGRLDKSMEALQKAHALAPKDIDILRELGIVYFLSGKIDQAIENLEEVQSILQVELDQNDDPLNIYYLGRGYQERGDLAKTLPLFLKIKEEQPEFVEVYHNLGSVYGRMGQKGLSHFYYGKYFKLRRDGKNALLHFRTAFEWLEKGSPEIKETEEEIKELTRPG
jgi:predicted Zn-dependent protease